MNTREMADLQHWDEEELQALVVRYVRTFRRFPSYRQLIQFRRARAHLAMRLPRQRRHSGPPAIVLRNVAAQTRPPDPLRTTG
jgi:hypothetical protein